MSANNSINPSASEVTVTELQRDQTAAAVALFSAQLREHSLEDDPVRVRTVLEQYLADPRHGFVLVGATGKGELVAVALGCAFLGVEHGGISGWLDEFYVAPQFRGAGVGTKILERFIAIAQERGWRAIDLEVEDDHQRVISLYSRFGFQPHTRTRFVRDLT